MADFHLSVIEIRYYADNWGPYSFDFTGFLPSDAIITGAVVKAYIGDVQPTSNLADFTEITEDIIDTDMGEFVEDKVVSVYFKYKETLKGEKATLLFELTLESGAKNVAYFQFVKIM